MKLPLEFAFSGKVPNLTKSQVGYINATNYASKINNLAFSPHTQFGKIGTGRRRSPEAERYQISNDRTKFSYGCLFHNSLCPFATIEKVSHFNTRLAALISVDESTLVLIRQLGTYSCVKIWPFFVHSEALGAFLDVIFGTLCK